MMKRLLLSTTAIAVAATYVLLQQSPAPEMQNQTIAAQTASSSTVVIADTPTQNQKESEPETVQEPTALLSSEDDSTQSSLPHETITETTEPQESTGPWDFAAQQPSPELVAQIRAERRRQLATQLDSLLTQETNDTGWQNTLASQTQEAMNLLPALNGISVASTFCGTTVCKLTLSARDAETFRQMRGVAPGMGLFLHSDAWAYSNQEALLTDVYLSRPGETLPFI